jgi:hypothetical protein
VDSKQAVCRLAGTCSDVVKEDEMKRWPVAVLIVALSALPGSVVSAQEAEADESAVIAQEAEADETYMDEEYDERNRWAFGIAVGLVELGDNVIEGQRILSDDDVEPYFAANLRIPIGDRSANYGSSRGGFQGYLEPELGYWSGDLGSDLLAGVNLIGGMPFNAVEFFLGAGIGIHFLDQDYEGVEALSDDGSSTALGVNAQFGLDVSVSENIAFFGVGRFDLVDDDRDELEGKAYLGLRFRF